MRTLAISMCVLEQNGEYLLQERSADIAKGAAGMTAAFGGQIEPGEAPEAACVRELSEETSLVIDPQTLNYLGNVAVVSDRDSQPVEVDAYTYYYSVDPEVTVTAREGILVRVKKDEVSTINTLSPATKACFETLL